MIIELQAVMAYVAAIFLGGIVIKTLPRILTLAHLDKRVYENILSLVNAAIIIYILLLLVIVPIIRWIGEYAVFHIPL